MRYLKPMLPTLVADIPIGSEWLYEVKYDGFRAMIYIDGNDTKIISRNLNMLNDQFPEIVQFFQQLTHQHDLVPLILDGELCVLETVTKANFDKIQKRGRLKNKEKIDQAKNSFPVTFLAFDLIMLKGNFVTQQTLEERKKLLTQTFKEWANGNNRNNGNYGNNVNNTNDENNGENSNNGNKRIYNNALLQLVDTYTNPTILWENVKKENGEGIVAKRINSPWQEGQRSKQWLKIKNLLIASFFVLAYDEKNTFFHIGCLQRDEVKMIGKVGQGFSKEEKEALITIVKKNSSKKQQSVVYIEPSICIEVEFLEMSKNELRHPKFRRFRFDKHWEECTWEAIQKAEQN